MSDTTERAETTDAGATGAAPTGAATQAVTEQAEASRFTQDDVNRFIAKEKDAWKKQQAAEVAEAKRKAAEAEAASKGEFEKLATERGTELEQVRASLEAATARIEAYEAVLERQIKARVKSLPEKVRGKLPDADTITRYAWLEMVEELAAEVGPPRGAPDINAGARGNGTRTPQDVITAEAERLRRSGRYGGF